MRAAVIGAGAVGLTVAHLLAESDAVTEVHVHEARPEAASGATAYAGASDVPHGWTERHRRLVETGEEWHRAFGAGLGADERYRHRTGTFWRSGTPESDARIRGLAYGDLAEVTRPLALDGETPVRGLLGEGYVISPQRLTALLLDRLRAGGRTTFRFGTPVAADSPLADGVVVDAAGGREEYDAVVVAAGPWAPGLLPPLAGSGVRTKQVYGYRFAGDPERPLTTTVVDLEKGAFLFPQPTVPGSYAMSVKHDVFDVPVAEGEPSPEADAQALAVARDHLGPRARLTERRIFVDTYTEGSVPVVADLSGTRRLVCVSGTHGSGIRLAAGLAVEACALLGVAA
ncbi:FAD-binding oxidoreductase [Streptomyces sp. NPDC020807]|uniref:NAD(P)/FAD-dependent oxidoreductase n=1 Tax=Streptomyces sp. NPDC020807 TaxID=3155119 RepID=UPI00340AD878